MNYDRFWKVAAIASAAALVAASLANAQVGEPTGTFGIRIRQGANTLVDNASVAVPLDIKISDNTPPDFVQIGTIGARATPIILKIVTDDDPSFRISHWYIDVPASTQDIYSPGPTSLFNPSDPSPIEVSITGLSFSGTTGVTPLVVNNDTYATAFMRDLGGVFYNLPAALTTGYPGPGTQVQTPGSRFLDGNAGEYTFGGTFFQPTASWTWGMIPNPGPSTTVNNGIDPFAPNLGGGYVFELGLGVSFVGIPEPATLGFFVSGMIPILWARRGR